MPDDKYFLEENLAQTEEKVSPSKRFRLVIRYYKTKAGCWNYSRGTVYRISDNQQICDIKRNYSTFHNTFITKEQQEWLITGRSYMSQTIVNLDTGKEYEPSGDQHNGSAFCWSSVQITPDEKTLVVTGCYWAAPYEIKFFDFTNPEMGWPEIPIEPKNEYVDADDKLPTFEDGKVICCETRKVYKPLNKEDDDLDSADLEKISDYDYENEDNWEHVVHQRLTLERRGNEMVVIEKWVSEAEQERRRKNEEARKRFEAWLEDFKANDPLYLKYKELLNKLPNKFADYESYGTTYAGWAPNFSGSETRWCRRILERDNKNPYTVDLEWGVKTGPIKLQIFKDGNKFEDKFFEHSVDGMIQAFNHVKSL